MRLRTHVANFGFPALLCSMIWAIPAAAQPSEGSPVHQTVPPKEFQAKLDEIGGKLLDVRTPQEFGEGYLKGAVNIDFYEDDFQDRLEQLPKDSAYFVYCRSGGRSGKTLQMMKDLGFRLVYDMGGGITRWQKEGLHVEPGEKP